MSKEWKTDSYAGSEEKRSLLCSRRPAIRTWRTPDAAVSVWGHFSAAAGALCCPGCWGCGGRAPGPLPSLRCLTPPIHMERHKLSPELFMVRALSGGMRPTSVVWGKGRALGASIPRASARGLGAAMTVGKTEGDRLQRAEYEAVGRQGIGHLSPSSTLELSFCDGRGSGTREEEASAKITLPSLPPLQEATVGCSWESGRRDARTDTSGKGVARGPGPESSGLFSISGIPWCLEADTGPGRGPQGCSWRLGARIGHRTQ